MKSYVAVVDAHTLLFWKTPLDSVRAEWTWLLRARMLSARRAVVGAMGMNPNPRRLATTSLTPSEQSGIHSTPLYASCAPHHWGSIRPGTCRHTLHTIGASDPNSTLTHVELMPPACQACGGCTEVTHIGVYRARKLAEQRSMALYPELA